PTPSIATSHAAASVSPCRQFSLIASRPLPAPTPRRPSPGCSPRTAGPRLRPLECPSLERVGVGRPKPGNLFLQRLDGRQLLGDDEPLAGRAPRRLLSDAQLGPVQEPVVDEGRPEYALIAPRFGQVVFANLLSSPLP